MANDASGRKLKFLRRIPIDPMTKTAEWGMRSYQDKPDSTSWGGQNVFDVFTKSDGHRARRHEVQGLVGPMLKLASGPRGRTRASSLPASRAGFTLIELMVVIALISVLAGMGVVQYRNSVVRTKEAVLREDLFRMRDAIDQYYADKAKYPASLDALVSEGYLRQVPKDPITNSTDTWQTVPSEPDPNNPTARSASTT